MKKFLTLALLLSLSIGCGHFGDKKSSGDTSQQEVSKVDQFINEYSSQYINDKEYLSAYREYLNSVEDFYMENGIEEKFDSYLQSLRENNEQLAQLRKDLMGSEKQTGYAQPWTGDSEVSQDERGPLGLGDEDRIQAETEKEIGDWRNEAEGVGGSEKMNDKKIEKQLNKTSKMTTKYDMILKEREQKLRSELGDDLFRDLKENYSDFQANFEGTKYYFPI